MTKKRFPINEQDLAIFQQAMKDVKPLKKEEKIRPELSKRKKPTKRRYEPETESLNLNESLSLDPVQSEEFISYKQADISNKILRNLRKGQYNVEAILDLHGFIIEEARSAVDNFLQQCLQERIRVVLIIHGKGYHSSQQPILKNKLNHWLRELPSVLAFCSAAPRHGSRGAIYVLLKRYAKED
jgi:DNA-nicking Smr family endonuclease